MQNIYTLGDIENVINNFLFCSIFIIKFWEVNIVCIPEPVSLYIPIKSPGVNEGSLHIKSTSTLKSISLIFSEVYCSSTTS